MTPASRNNIGTTGRRHMHGPLRALAMLTVLMPLCASAANEKLLVELNSIEGADNRCRLNFVIQNKSDIALESMKLDLVLRHRWQHSAALAYRDGPGPLRQNHCADIRGRGRMSANRFDPGQRRDRMCARRAGRVSRRPRPLVTAAGASSLQITSASARRAVAPSRRPGPQVSTPPCRRRSPNTTHLR